LRSEARNLVLNFAFRLVAGFLQQPMLILRRQMRSQQSERRQRETAIDEEIDHDGKRPHRPSGLDAVIGGVFRQVEHLGAEREERRAAFSQIQPARIELREKPDEMDRSVALVSGSSADSLEEISIR
jgi:hypothetical protein